MEVFNGSISASSKFYHRFPFVIPNHSFTTYGWPKSFKSRRFQCQARPKLPSEIYNRFSNRSVVRISAHFGRRSNRRNFLRRKLTDHLLQLRGDTLNLTVGNEDDFCQTYVETNELEKVGEIASFREIDSVKENSSGRQNEFGESVLLDKLQSWTEQYKKDMEFWGVGSGSIFTVFRNSNGKVERVVVDEDEIMRRSGVLPSEFREVGEFGQVGLKLSYAKYVAEEMERGNSVLQESSTVTKVVVSAQTSTLKSEIRNILMHPNIVPKLSLIGSVTFFGLLLLWAVNKLFQKGGNKELTKSEKEMMRRKMKFRKEKELSMKGSVEVLHESIEPDTVVYERPGLDKEELMNSISNAAGEGSSYPLAVLDSIAKDAPSSNMDKKMQEIGDMARHAHEMEVQATEVSVNHSTIDVGEASKQEEWDLNALNYVPDESCRKLNVASFVEQSEASEMMLDCGSKSSSSACEEELADRISSMLTTESGKINVSNKEESNSGLNNVISMKNSSGSEKEATLLQETSMRKKPRVIISVTEAREYLSSKQDKEAGDKRPLNSDFTDQKEDLAQKDGEEELTLNHLSQQLVSENISHNPSDLTGRSNDRLSGIVSDKLSLNVNGDMLNTISLNGKAETPNVTANAEDSSVRMKQNVNGEQKMTDSSMSSSMSTIGSNMNANHNVKYDAKERNGINAEITGLNIEVLGTSHGINACKPAPDEELKVDSYESLDNGQNGPVTLFGSDVSDPTCASIPLEDSELEKKLCLTEDSAVQEKDCMYDKINGLNVEVEGSEHGITAYEPAPAHETEVGSYQNSGRGQAGPETTNDFSSDESGPTSAALPLHDSRQEEKPCLSAKINNDEHVMRYHATDEVLSSNAAKNSVNSGKKLEAEQAPANKATWLEKNFNELAPVVEKIEAGFRTNYSLAREKAREGSNIGSNITELQSIFDDSELQWMNDDLLRGIVFRVRDNELAGREPFHLISDDDKMTFFRGLEEKAEKVNDQVSALHDWLHSNIENLDYGADGISIYDPPEKTVPRWKGPSVDTIRELVTKTLEERLVHSTSSKSSSSQPSVNLSKEKVATRHSDAHVSVSKKPETVIESSDGSVRPGKKQGTEYWEHTKKWSKGFLEKYNAETDPEVKAVMRDMGKDLDRWVTEEDIEKGRRQMDKISKVTKHVLDKKFTKLKREVEQFGHKAVVDKYSEYAVTEEDYLWWLDLPYVLCIEMYTRDETGKEEVGFYTVEMAKDLELEPTPHHVIAFEDPVSCKNFNHILQTHLEMFGSGKAYVVAQPPKDVFRGARENGFGVTVIRKGELALNIDQALEEVEELISEIGSKIYHDKITKEHKIDMWSVLKGMNVAGKIERRKHPRKRPRRFKLKKPKKV